MWDTLLHRFNVMDLISANANANSDHLTFRSCDTLPFFHQESQWRLESQRLQVPTLNQVFTVKDKGLPGLIFVPTCQCANRQMSP